MQNKLTNLRNSPASLSRPAWTSERKTGMLEAYKHLHAIQRGRFILVRDYFEKGRK